MSLEWGASHKCVGKVRSLSDGNVGRWVHKDKENYPKSERASERERDRERETETERGGVSIVVDPFLFLLSVAKGDSAVFKC